jgi:hypothetical protein
VTMSEFETLLGRIDKVDSNVAAIREAFAAHCAAEEARARPRASVSTIVAAVAAVASVVAAYLAVIGQHVR